jgi:hypothetical protein
MMAIPSLFDSGDGSKCSKGGIVDRKLVHASQPEGTSALVKKFDKFTLPDPPAGIHGVKPYLGR